MEASTAPLRASGAASTALARAAVPQASTVRPWPSPSAHAERWEAAVAERSARVMAASTGRGDAVGVEFGAGVEGGRDLAEDAGAQPLLGAGGHPVRRQRQGGGRHEAQHGGGNDGGQRGRQQQARCR